ncbi:unnamed protein product, partial [Laminaria digitata]
CNDDSPSVPSSSICLPSSQVSQNPASCFLGKRTFSASTSSSFQQHLSRGGCWLIRCWLVSDWFGCLLIGWSIGCWYWPVRRNNAADAARKPGAETPGRGVEMFFALPLP